MIPPYSASEHNLRVWTLDILQPKQFQPFWVQLPDIHPTKVLLTKDRLPDGIILPPVATGLV
jgi:hypothetical protein